MKNIPREPPLRNSAGALFFSSGSLVRGRRFTSILIAWDTLVQLFNFNEFAFLQLNSIPILQDCPARVGQVIFFAWNFSILVLAALLGRGGLRIRWILFIFLIGRNLIYRFTTMISGGDIILTSLLFILFLLPSYEENPRPQKRALEKNGVLHSWIYILFCGSFAWIYLSAITGRNAASWISGQAMVNLLKDPSMQGWLSSTLQEHLTTKLSSFLSVLMYVTEFSIPALIFFSVKNG